MHFQIKPLSFRRAPAIVLAACALLLGCPESQTDAAAAEKIPLATAKALSSEAEALLDQWRGQSPLLDQAAEKLFFALKKDPKYARAYVQVGRLHIMAGHYHSQYFEPSSLEASEKALKNAIALDGKLADAYVVLGHLYTIRDRLPEAKTALTKAAEIKTDSPWLAMNWAAIFEKENKDEEAAQKYAEVIASKTKNLKALGAAYEGQRDYYFFKGDLQKADEIYNAHILIEPTAAWIRGNYASSLVFTIGDFDKGIAKAREALSIMQYGNARRTLAFGLYGKWATDVMQKRDSASAKKYFDEAQTIYPDLVSVRAEASRYGGTRIIADALLKENK